MKTKVGTVSCHVFEYLNETFSRRERFFLGGFCVRVTYPKDLASSIKPCMGGKPKAGEITTLGGENFYVFV